MLSKEYRQIAKSVAFLGVLALLGLFFSVGIPYPFLNKNVVHCPVGDMGDEFVLVSTYRKYVHLGMFFTDVWTRSHSSDYKIYFKLPNRLSRTKLNTTLWYVWHKAADKEYCPYFGMKKNTPYMFDGRNIFLSEDGGKHFEERTKGARLFLEISHFGLEDRVIGGKRYTVDWISGRPRNLARAIVNPPGILVERAAFVTSARCGEENFLYKNRKFCEQNEDIPVIVSRRESLDLGRTWTDPVVTSQSELFQLTPIEAVPPLGDPAS